MALVFQYGSNTSSQRLNSQCRLRGDAISLCLATTIDDFDIGFTVHSDKNGCAAADMVPSLGTKVVGVLYEIPDHLLSRDTAGKRKSLDAIEGRRYRRHTIHVCRADDPQSPATVWTYTVIEKQTGLRTSADYARHILDGLREHHAPQEYIDRVRQRVIENNPDLQGQI